MNDGFIRNTHCLPIMRHVLTMISIHRRVI
nr:MAG TPA: hypothetical protein [Caudoviricetes sp.]DAY32714.1 MAG TPA: hypothetical protein [Caudoviricetes sp.]